MKKIVLSAPAYAACQARWATAVKCRDFIIRNVYDEFMSATDKIERIDNALGVELTSYREKVEALGGVDLGITPAGIPGGGMLPGK